MTPCFRPPAFRQPTHSLRQDDASEMGDVTHAADLSKTGTGDGTDDGTNHTSMLRMASSSSASTGKKASWWDVPDYAYKEAKFVEQVLVDPHYIWFDKKNNVYKGKDGIDPKYFGKEFPVFYNPCYNITTCPECSVQSGRIAVHQPCKCPNPDIESGYQICRSNQFCRSLSSHPACCISVPPVRSFSPCSPDGCMQSHIARFHQASWAQI